MFTVFLVDDDTQVLKALSRLMRSRGYDVRPYVSPQEFLADHDPAIPGCAILDLSMPGADGLELQRVMAAAGCHRPVIFLTGRGSIMTSVRAMKAGAIDFLTKPVKNQDLLDAVADAEQEDARSRLLQAERATIQAKIATLTPREREVFAHVAAGRRNKQIAYDLGIVERTIKLHRGAVMKKLEVRSVAELVRLAEKADVAH